MTSLFSRVVSVRIDGEEGAMIEDDLELRRSGNYSLFNAARTSTTTDTLALEKLACEHLGVAFIQVHSGMVSTNLLDEVAQTA